MIYVFWGLLLIVAIVATVRGWGYRPWALLTVPFIWQLYVAYTGLRLIDATGKGEFLKAYVLLEQIDSYYAILLVMQFVVLVFLLYFAMIRRIAEVKSTSLNANTVPKVRNEYNERIEKLDSLLQNNLIDVEEHQQRKLVIDQEWVAAVARKDQERIASMSRPYVVRMRAFQLLFEQKMISQEVLELERQNLLRRLIQ